MVSTNRRMSPRRPCDAGPRAVSLLVLAAAVVLGERSACSFAATKPSSTCMESTEGSHYLSTVSGPTKRGSAFTFDITQEVDLAGGSASFVAVIRRGRRLVLRTTILLPSTTEAFVTYGTHYEYGFKGMRDVVLRTDGITVGGTVDGRPLQTTALTGAEPDLHFADGGAVPKLRVRRSVRKALLALSRKGVPSCTPPTQGSSVVPLGGIHPPTIANCSKCELGCYTVTNDCLKSFESNFSTYLACGISFWLTTPNLCYAAKAKECADKGAECTERCGLHPPKGGTPCCPLRCNDQIGCKDFGFCCGTNWCDEPDTYCADADPPNEPGLCCRNGEGTCYDDTLGDLKCGADCNGQCCAPENCTNGRTRCCEVYPGSLGTATVCGDDCCTAYGTPDDTKCVNGACCPYAKACGNKCCTSHEQCLADSNTCCPIAKVCNGKCCDGSSTCVDGQCIVECDPLAKEQYCPPPLGGPGGFCCHRGLACCGDDLCCLGVCCRNQFDVEYCGGGPDGTQCN
jgi:hypothetical protein